MIPLYIMITGKNMTTWMTYSQNINVCFKWLKCQRENGQNIIYTVTSSWWINWVRVSFECLINSN